MFNHKQILKMIEAGKSDAAAVISMGEGASFWKYLEMED
jgi:hypothetical protein